MVKGKKDGAGMDRIGIVMGIVIAVLVVATMLFYLAGAGGMVMGEIVPVGIAMMLVGFAMYVLRDRFRNVKMGLPAKDEMERRMNWRAGYYGFIAAIWGAVFGPLLIDILFGYELEGSRVTALVVIVSGITFALSYLYFRRKGIGE